MEWGASGIGVLGIAWDGGRRCSAVFNSGQHTLEQYLSALGRADTIVGQNHIDADMMQLMRSGINTDPFLGKCYDIRLAFHAVNAHLAGTGSFDLRSIVLLLNGRQGERFPLDFKQYKEDILRTCAMDSAAALWCHPTLDRLVKSNKLEKTLAIAHQVSPIFALMHERGVRLDKGVLETIYNARKEKTTQVIEHYHLWEERGKKVIKRVPIWRSDKILDICEKQFGFRPKDRQRSTWAKLLVDKSLSSEAKEFVEAVVDLGKGANDAHWLGSVGETEDGLSFDKVSSDGFIYPRYDICGSPDRAISASPNIQNFPRPADDPRVVPLRSAVIPKQEGETILGVDFSSVETITNAIESNDWDRVNAVMEKRITHEGTAAIINQAFGLSLTRHQGKAVNHGFDKGESPYNLARTIFKTDRPSRQQSEQCRDIFRKMLAAYPKTAKFRDDLWERAIENPLIVTNSFGRRLMCFSRSKYGEAGESRFAKHDPLKKYWCSCGACAPRRDRWKYAIAFLGRSAAFDALLRKMATIWYDKRIDQYSLPYLEVHDELDFSVPLDKVEGYAKILKETFESPIDELGGICLPASVVWGKSWAEAH